MPIALRRSAVLILGLALAVSACGGDGNDRQAATTTTPTLSIPIEIATENREIASASSASDDGACYFTEISYEVRDGNGEVIAAGTFSGDGVLADQHAYWCEYVDSVPLEESDFYEFRFRADGALGSYRQPWDTGGRTYARADAERGVAIVVP